jgi:hypothetical protein
MTFDSSVLAACTYDETTHTLDVEFTSGRVYRYQMVPRATYEALLQAPSTGRYFNAKIRDRYPSREVTGE